MFRTVEAIMDEKGTVRFLEKIRPLGVRRLLVTILGEDDDSAAGAVMHMSEASLSKDWDRPEEDAAWSHLEQER